MSDTQTDLPAADTDTIEDAGEAGPEAAAQDDPAASAAPVGDEVEDDAEESGDAVSDDDSDDDDEDDDEDDEGSDDESSADSADASADGERSRPRRGSSLRRLEEEGEIAADYLEELLDIIDLDGDIDIDVENGRASVAVVAEASAERELRRLVGARGEVLEALQELSRLAVQAKTGDRSRLMLDVAGFRAARRRTLEGVAARACQEVQRTGAPVRLEPMTAFERKVVHDVVADAGLESESEGEEPSRRVVVHPAAVADASA